MLERWTRVNGESCAVLSADDRGFAFGDGVFESMRVSNSCVPLLKLHLQRLQRGLEILEITGYEKTLNAELMHLRSWLQSQANIEGALRLSISRGDSLHGYGLVDAAPVCIVLRFLPGRISVPSSLHLEILSTAIYENPMLSGIKHLSRLENVLAQLELRKLAAADGVLCNRQGHLIETSSGNLLFLDGDSLVLPEMSGAGVQGVMSAYIENHIAPAMAWRVERRVVSRETLPSYSSAFKCNSLIGIVPILAIAEFEFVEHARSQDLRQHLETLWTCQHEIDP